MLAQGYPFTFSVSLRNPCEVWSFLFNFIIYCGVKWLAVWENNAINLIVNYCVPTIKFSLLGYVYDSISFNFFLLWVS